MSRLPWCAGCKRLLDQLPAAEASTLVAEGCLLYKDRSYAKARQKFLDAISFGGHQPELTYNAALCSYQMKQHGPALKQVGHCYLQSLHGRSTSPLWIGAQSTMHYHGQQPSMCLACASPVMQMKGMPISSQQGQHPTSSYMAVAGWSCPSLL